MLGSGVGLVLGGAYWLGERAQADASRARGARLAEAAARGFSQRELQREMQALDAGALAVAQRQDPFAVDAPHARANVFAGFEPRPTMARTPISSLSVEAVAGPARAGGAHVGMMAAPTARLGGGALESARDLACLTDAIYYEARGETAAGQVAVAQVVLNRVRHPAFPKSICGVVFQRAEARDGCQFSFVCDGAMRRQREPDAWRRAETIAARALDGSVKSSVGAATHFHVAGLDPGWGPRLLRVAQVGLHVFYRFDGRASDATRRLGAEDLAREAALPTADGAPSGRFILASATTASAVAPPPASTQNTPIPAKLVAPPEARVIEARVKDAAPERVEAAPKIPAPEAAEPGRPASVS
jgi:hypothetical protein